MFEQNLDRIATLFHDPVFWFSTIVCGILVTIIGNYVSRVADRVSASYQTKRRYRAETLETSVRAAANHLLLHPNERFDLQLDILFYSQRQIQYHSLLVAFSALAVFSLSIFPNTEYIGASILTVGLLAELMVAFYYSRELRTRRVLLAYHQMANIKTYKEILDEGVAQNK